MSQEFVVYIDGNFVPESEAKIPVRDRGILLGDAVTESTRTFGLRPFKLKEHLDRLALSIKAARIDLGMSMDELEKVTLEVLERNRSCFGPDDDAWLMHGVSRGMGPSGRHPGRTYPPSTVVVDCWSVDMTEILENFPTKLTSVRDYARTVAGS